MDFAPNPGVAKKTYGKYGDEAQRRIGAEAAESFNELLNHYVSDTRMNA